jgi:predicted PurR-regulated permease PerM
LARAIFLAFFGLLALVLAALYAHIIMLVFAAVLVAAVLDALIRLLMRLVPILPRAVAVILTLIFVVVLVIVAAIGGGVTIVTQFDALSRALAEAWDMVASQLNDWGLPVARTFDVTDIVEAIPEPQTIFGGAGAVLGTGFGLLSNMVIVFLTGIFLAIDPKRYRDGLAILLPIEARPRAREVLAKAGTTLQHWLVGQLALMAIVGGLTTVLLLVMGVSYGLTLGLIAGLLNFIPFVGPILAFVPIGLSMIGQDWTTALIVLGGYTLIQQFDANVTTPLIQDRVVNLAPALTIIFLLFMGVALGPLGVALGTPLLAALRVLVLELYVRDVLGDTPEKVD